MTDFTRTGALEEQTFDLETPNFHLVRLFRIGNARWWVKTANRILWSHAAGAEKRYTPATISDIINIGWPKREREREGRKASCLYILKQREVPKVWPKSNSQIQLSSSLNSIGTPTRRVYTLWNGDLKCVIDGGWSMLIDSATK